MRTRTNPYARKSYRRDCIHLNACRRVQYLVKQKTGFNVGRDCNEDCPEYEIIDWEDD